MSSTNLTKNLKLPQFVASDKPSWLGDVNGAMLNIDNGYGTLTGDISKANDTASSAKSQSDANTQTLVNVNSELESQGNRITALEAGGGTEQLEQRVGTLETDIDSLQTRTDTFEEEIAANGTNITNLQTTTSGLSDSVLENKGAINTLSTTVDNQGQRLQATETIASKAFNQSQENIHFISTLTNAISSKTSFKADSLQLKKPSGISNNIKGSQQMIVGGDDNMCTFLIQFGIYSLSLGAAPTNIGTVDLSGLIPNIADKNLFFNQASYASTHDGLILLDGAKDSNNMLSLSLSRPMGTQVTSIDNLVFIGTIIFN